MIAGIYKADAIDHSDFSKHVLFTELVVRKQIIDIKDYFDKKIGFRSHLIVMWRVPSSDIMGEQSHDTGELGLRLINGIPHNLKPIYWFKIGKDEENEESDTDSDDSDSSDSSDESDASSE